MTVAELIEKLIHLPPNDQVWAQSNYGTEHEIMSGTSRGADYQTLTVVWQDEDGDDE